MWHSITNPMSFKFSIIALVIRLCIAVARHNAATGAEIRSHEPLARCEIFDEKLSIYPRTIRAAIVTRNGDRTADDRFWR